MSSFNDVKMDKKWIKALIFGVSVSAALIAVLMCLMSIVFVISKQIPYEYLSYIMLFVDAVSVFVGGYVAARINKSRGLMLGLCVGAVIFCAMMISSLSTSGDSPTVITLIRAILILIFSAFGGIKGVNTKEKIRIK